MDMFLYSSEYTCRCGDVNDNSAVNLGDIVYLNEYLFRGDPPPVDPIERGDANNDCVIDMGDIIYLINYLYYGEASPKCCWIHE